MFFSYQNPIVFAFKIAHKVKEIRNRLDEIAEDRKNFHFREHVYVRQEFKDKEREQTHSFVVASEIVGRDSDTKLIVDVLLATPDDQENVYVLPIVGLGGLGKTTVVKLVYNDERVVENFDLRMWVCLSEEFRLSKILEKILRSATGENFSHLDTDQLQGHFRDIVNDKRYLLVLDDVWNEDFNTWMEFRELLSSSCSGSRVIVTTRSKMVAKITGTISSYNLSGLPDSDCLSLFLKCAFRGQDGFSNRPDLIEIGKQIVNKCGGVPLAVKTLGSLLYMKVEEQEWLRVRDNEIWEIEQKESDILPILRLSYEQMPSYLRQCFAYCSMLPKDYEIPREVFINIWIAQGGVIPSGVSSRKMEEVGNQYFNELLSRFCFHDVVEAFDGEIIACRIHNLVHDLAQSVARSECINVKSSTREISGRVRHLHFNPEEDSMWKKLLEIVLKFRKLRSFTFSIKSGSMDKDFAMAILSKFKRLRVLILKSLELEELPNSIGNLVELRYLNLSNSSKIKFLPTSITKLVNLQTLDLINCEQLQDVPKRIGEMRSIKTLYLTSRQISLKKHRETFSSLQLLLFFKCYFLRLPSEGFQQFKELRVLRIYECPRLVSISSIVKHLTALEKLWIWDCQNLDLSDGEGMDGLKNLQSLLLMGLPKLVTLPEGLQQIGPLTLKYLRIANCPNLLSLPDWLPTFTSLLKVYIEDCPNLQYVPQGMYHHTAQLHISDCPQLNEAP
ncbi:hypothetical protein Leryth_013934 [Lithospermum erythrorhizon]|nr:hypothetical protein Leryth_013934 [Lithospermum erythrorhizon]